DVLAALGVLFDLVAAVHLARPDDAGLGLEHAAKSGRIKVREIRIFGARADERHVAEQHVEKLRKLVELGPAQEMTDRRDAGVAFDGEPRAASIRADDHRAELEDAEDAAARPRALLAEEDRSARVELDERRDDGEHRPQ